MTAPTIPGPVAVTALQLSQVSSVAAGSGQRNRAIEHLIGGRVVCCWRPSLCDVCTPVPATVPRLDTYRLRDVRPSPRAPEESDR